MKRTPSQRGKLSRAKGNSNERALAWALTKVFYPNGGGHFIRTPMSGAWGGVTITSGDVIPIRDGKIDYEIPFYFEAKHYKDVPFDAILRGESPVLMGWLKKALLRSKAECFPLYPHVVWKVNLGKWNIFMSWLTYSDMRKRFGELPERRTILISHRGEFSTVNIPFEVWSDWVGAWVLEQHTFHSRVIPFTEKEEKKQ